jgi:UDP-2,4-diacetamido-2,4,6-trideoxy-beta-L-altropyranose hydrolase
VAKKYIAFRVDASIHIGTGHFMRCLTLADELKKQAAKIRFISLNLPAHLSDMLIQKGVEYSPLNIDDSSSVTDELAHASWLGSSQAQDAQATLQALADQKWDLIIVDHYALDERWERLVRDGCKKLIVIDDLADRQHDCDILLDQNYYADMQTRYVSKVPAHCQLLLGPQYALLRKEFRTLHEKVKVRGGNVKKILVFFGGVDADNYTSLAIQALAQLNIKQQVTVVIGVQHPNREQILQACINHGFICYVQTTRMAELMAESDLAIGAGGSASWERCCLGLPALLVAVSRNQIDIAKSLDSIGACYYLGEKHAVNFSTIQNSFNEFLLAPDHIMSISQQAFSLVDGLGVNRVSEALGC